MSYKNPAAAVGECRRAGKRGDALLVCALNKKPRAAGRSWTSEVARLSKKSAGLGAVSDYRYFVLTKSGKIAAGYEYKNDAVDFKRDNDHVPLRVVSRGAAPDPKKTSNWTRGADLSGAERRRRRR